MWSTLTDWLRAADPYFFRLVGRDVYEAVADASPHTVVAAGVVASAAGYFALQVAIKYFVEDVPTEDDGDSVEENAENTNDVSDADAGIQMPLEKRGFAAEDYTQYFDDLEELDEDERSDPARANMISRIKIARQKAINRRVEETLTKSDKIKEKMIEAQQLAKIYALLNESDEGGSAKMSIEDVKSQMSMYKPAYGKEQEDIHLNS